MSLDRGDVCLDKSRGVIAEVWAKLTDGDGDGASFIVAANS